MKYILEMLRAKCDVIQIESYILLLRVCSLIYIFDSAGRFPLKVVESCPCRRLRGGQTQNE